MYSIADSQDDFERGDSVLRFKIILFVVTHTKSFSRNLVVFSLFWAINLRRDREAFVGWAKQSVPIPTNDDGHGLSPFAHPTKLLLIFLP
jgi:hypothetical protein